MLFFVIISALFYSFSFIFIDQLYCLSFVFLTSIAYSLNSNKFKNGLFFGFIWATLAFSIQQFGLYLSLINITEKIYITLILAIFTIIYQAFYGALWFYLIEKLTYIKNIFLKSLFFSILTFLYFYFLENYLLFFFSNKAEGLIILNPIILMSLNKNINYIIRLFGPDIALFLFILNSALISLIFIIKNKFIKLNLIIIFFLPFMLGFFLKNKDTKIDYIKKNITVIQKAFYNKKNNEKSAQEIANQIKIIKGKNKIIIFPESSFYLCDLKKEKELIKYFDKEVNIIIGALRNKKDRVYNALYHIYNGKIVNKFYKRHSLLLTERLPFFYFNFINNILLKTCFKKRPLISESLKKRKYFKIDNLKFIPYICSEIFFNKYPDDDFKEDDIIISVCNDSWISKYAHYLKKMMATVNKFKAITWKRYVIYVDYSSAFIFDKFSNQIKL